MTQPVTATEIATGVQSGAFRAETIAHMALARIEAYAAIQPAVWIHRLPEAQVLAFARAVDARIVAGEKRGGQPTLGLMDIGVARNAFGRQVDSFETDVEAPEVARATGWPAGRTPRVSRCSSSS